MDDPTYNDGKTFEEIVKEQRARMPQDVFEAHGHSINNKNEIEKSDICGCFYCLHTFKPAEIKEWVTSGNDDTFPMCPYCGIDSVLGNESGYPITQEFLSEMNKYWFEGTVVVIEDKPNNE